MRGYYNRYGVTISGTDNPNKNFKINYVTSTLK